MFCGPHHADNCVEMSGSPPNGYLRNEVMQASPEQLQLMLYDGAVRFTTKGRQAILDGNYEETYDCLGRAQKIVLEMEGGLRPEVNAEVCEQMAALFNFVYRKLVSGGLDRDVSAIDDALKILKHQRETWVMLMDKVSKLRAGLPDNAETPSENRASISIQG